MFQLDTHIVSFGVLMNDYVLICQGGCADSCSQVIPLLFMALGQKDVSKIRLGELSSYTYGDIEFVIMRPMLGYSSYSCNTHCSHS